MKLNIISLSLLLCLSLKAAEKPEPFPKFEEVYQLLRTNGSGLTEAELNRAAVAGLLNELESHVVLVTDGSPGIDNTNSLKASVFDDAFASLRVARIEANADESLKAAYRKLLSTNKIKGVVLDLRYASGTDYAAAAKIADLFIKTEQPLLRWGEASARSTAKTNAISVPVAILVNHRTSGAAEALAGILREAQVGLIIGTNTAGQASVFKEFELETGQRLKIATAPVKLGNGNEISDEGLKPDIEIVLNAEDEKAFYENPYHELPKPFLVASTDTNNPTASSETNRPRRRLNEAELVRLQRQGLVPDEDFIDDPARAREVSKPIVNDPALVRALDLLKGLSVVQQSRRN